MKNWYTRRQYSISLYARLFLYTVCLINLSSARVLGSDRICRDLLTDSNRQNSLGIVELNKEGVPVRVSDGISLLNRQVTINKISNRLDHQEVSGRVLRIPDYVSRSYVIMLGDGTHDIVEVLAAEVVTLQVHGEVGQGYESFLSRFSHWKKIDIEQIAHNSKFLEGKENKKIALFLNINSRLGLSKVVSGVFLKRTSNNFLTTILVIRSDSGEIVHVNDLSQVSDFRILDF